MYIRKSTILIACTLVCALSACRRGRLGVDNPDVAAQFSENKYRGEIVTGQERHDYEDQGKGIDPKTLQAIEDTIASVYQRDFERCLESQMADLDTRFLRCVFRMEFTINPEGKVSQSKVLDIGMSQQNAKGKNLGAVDPTAMKECLVQAVMGWEFEPAPEVDYVHTYNGQVGEAF